MQPIAHDASDKALGKSIDVFNDAVEQHQQTAAAIARPPDVSDDECAVMTVAMIETHRQALTSERLAHLQTAVSLGRQQVELSEGIESEVKHRADQADKSYDDVHSKTAAKLEKAGLGPASTPAGRIGYARAAERQFAVQILQSADVRAAEIEKKHQRGKLGHAVQQVATAKSDLVDAQSKLRMFVHNQIKGNHHVEVQVPDRTNRSQPRFQKA